MPTRSLELGPRGEALLHQVDASEVAELQAQPLGYGWGAPLAVPALPRALRPSTLPGRAPPQGRRLLSFRHHVCAQTLSM